MLSATESGIGSRVSDYQAGVPGESARSSSDWKDAMNIFPPATALKIRACIAFARASSAAIGLTVAIAFAQQPQTAGPVSLGELFTGPDSVDLKGDSEEKIREAAAKAINPRGCPQKAKFTVRVGPGDRTFQGALAAARRDVIKALLQNQPGRFDVTDEVGGSYDVQVDYDRMPDREPPKLHTSSVPPKGTKVHPGSRIKITMIARDDATPTQTGIQSIQLLAQGPGGDERVGGENYRPVTRPNCEGRPEPRTLEVTYTVPQNPPPIVKLVAITEDFVNLTDIDRAEFPTADLAGQLTFSRDHPPPRGITSSGEMDVTLNRLTDGKFEGELTGVQRIQIHMPQCRVERAATMRAKVKASYSADGEAIALEITEQAYAPALGFCAGQRIVDTELAAYTWPGFEQLARNLRRTADGAYAAEGEFTPNPRGNTFKYELRLKPAAD